MASQWYYAVGDAEKGPVSSKELKSLVDSGQLSPEDQVWKEGMAEWVAGKTIPNLFSASAPNPPGRSAAGASGGIPNIDIGESSPVGRASSSEPLFDIGSDDGQVRGTRTSPTGRSGGSNATMQDYLTFRKMITPLVIQIVFWLLAGLCVLAGLLAMMAGANAARGGGYLVIQGLLTIFVGPLIVRIYCELLIVIFSINDTLLDTKKLLERQSR